MKIEKVEITETRLVITLNETERKWLAEIISCDLEDIRNNDSDFGFTSEEIISVRKMLKIFLEGLGR